VLAEGVNLHRANVIVNYDSPWNATRLMQRIGRVNRIGSTANAIHNYMFYPSDPGDAIISLRKTPSSSCRASIPPLAKTQESFHMMKWCMSSSSSMPMYATKPTVVWNC
jgi:Superfamily II DNA and RNA helicases